MAVSLVFALLNILGHQVVVEGVRNNWIKLLCMPYKGSHNICTDHFVLFGPLVKELVDGSHVQR